MDEIKSSGFNTMFNWHFIDTPFIPFKDVEAKLDWKADNSVLVMQDVLRVLKQDKPYTVFMKVWSLRLLVHIIGDMHQPLHNTSLYSKAFPEGDMGGNLIKVKMDVDQSKLKYPLVSSTD